MDLSFAEENERSSVGKIRSHSVEGKPVGHNVKLIDSKSISTVGSCALFLVPVDPRALKSRAGPAKHDQLMR